MHVVGVTRMMSSLSRIRLLRVVFPLGNKIQQKFQTCLLYTVYMIDVRLLRVIREGCDITLPQLLPPGNVCSELRARTPPRGVQLTLGSRAAPHATGTIVMSNLGYFQLQATAGLFTLSLKPGSSTKVYSIASARSLRETDNSLVAEAAEDDEPVETQVHAVRAQGLATVSIRD